MSNCEHCGKAQAPCESFFWVHHGNPGPIPGYCVACATAVLTAAWRVSTNDGGRIGDWSALKAAARPAPKGPTELGPAVDRDISLQQWPALQVAMRSREPFHQDGKRYFVTDVIMTGYGAEFRCKATLRPAVAR